MMPPVPVRPDRCAWCAGPEKSSQSVWGAQCCRTTTTTAATVTKHPIHTKSLITGRRSHEHRYHMDPEGVWRALGAGARGVHGRKNGCFYRGNSNVVVLQQQTQIRLPSVHEYQLTDYKLDRTASTGTIRIPDDSLEHHLHRVRARLQELPKCCCTTTTSQILL